MEGFLPVSRQDMERQGIRQLDFVYICGDAYVDHPSFGHAIIGRVLQSRGYTVGMIPQPDVKDENAILVLGEPRLALPVPSRNMEYRGNHSPVSNTRRQIAAFSPRRSTETRTASD